MAAFDCAIVPIQMAFAISIAIPIDTVFIFADSLAQRIAMDSQLIRSFGKVVMMAIDNLLNKSLFKFLDGLIKENAAGNHLVNQGFQFSFHGMFLKHSTPRCHEKEKATPCRMYKIILPPPAFV
ncbi:MAG: hypothetical protein ABIP14_03165 [Blastocatellia bacterium]